MCHRLEACRGPVGAKESSPRPTASWFLASARNRSAEGLLGRLALHRLTHRIVDLVQEARQEEAAVPKAGRVLGQASVLACLAGNDCDASGHRIAFPSLLEVRRVPACGGRLL